MRGQRLSIVLCTYNGAAFLSRQLESFLSQTRQPDEIVIGDDASTDGTRDILEAFSEEASSRGIEVKLMRHASNLGYVGNFSTMLRHATGDLLFLSDQDDVWRNDKLEVMASQFRQDDSLMLLHSDARLIDEKGSSTEHGLFELLELSDQERRAVRAGDAFGVLLRRNIVTGATAAMRRVVVEQALPVRPGWIHDEWLAVIASVIGRVDFLDEPLIDYRQHGQNQIGIRKRTLRKRLDDLMGPQAKLIEETLVRLNNLADRLRDIRPFPARQVERIEDMLSHLAVRQRMMGGRMRRLIPIYREYIRGRYRLYNTGMRGALRDFLCRG